MAESRGLEPLGSGLRRRNCGRCRSGECDEFGGAGEGGRSQGNAGEDESAQETGLPDGEGRSAGEQGVHAVDKLGTATPCAECEGFAGGVETLLGEPSEAGGIGTGRVGAMDYGFITG